MPPSSEDLIEYLTQALKGAPPDVADILRQAIEDLEDVRPMR